MKKQTKFVTKPNNGTITSPEIHTFNGETVQVFIQSLDKTTGAMVYLFRQVLVPQIVAYSTDSPSKEEIEVECLFLFGKTYKMEVVPESKLLIDPITLKRSSYLVLTEPSKLENFNFDTMKKFINFVRVHYAQEGLIWQD